MKYYIFPVVISILVASCSSENKKATDTTTSKAVAYEVATLVKGGVSSRLRLPAQLAAYQEVSIFPKVNGYVKTVFVDIGSKVTKGSLLMELEAPELSAAVMQAKEKYAHSKVQLSIDQERYNRLLEASKTAGAISPLDLSTVRASVEADSALCNAAKANWQMQETMLGYLRVSAPFTGVITERNIHPGALVNASSKDKPMLELKQVDRLRLQVDVPEVIANDLKEKDTVSFYVSALQGKKLTGFINRSAMNVDAKYRSERIEVDVDNKEGLLSPGMFADVVLYSNGNLAALTVPKTAVVVSTERKYVLVVDGEKIKKVDVKTGNETADKVEVYGDLKEGEKVIAVANDEIKEG